MLVAADQDGAPVTVTVRAVDTDEDAEQVGFTRSRTVWLDGVNPFAQAGAMPWMPD